MCRQANRGFTLIELLVVIAIIAVLAAILFPVFAKAREKSFQTTCINNQRQFVLGILGYAQDNDETLPLPPNWVTATGLQTDMSIFHCPSSSNNATPANPDYGMNAYLFDVDSGGMQDGVPMGEILNPQKVECTADLNAISSPLPSGWTGPYPGNTQAWLDYDPFPNSYTITGLNTPSIALRHNGGVIISYLDGHVEFRQPTYTVTTCSKYNLGPGMHRYYIDFSTFNDPVAAASAINYVFNTGTVGAMPGYLATNASPHSWYIPAGTQSIRPTPNDTIGANGSMFGITYTPHSANTDFFIHGPSNMCAGQVLEICPGGQ